MRYSTYKFVKYRCWILGFLNIHFDFISKLDFWFRFILKDSGPMVVRRFSVQSGSDLAVILPVQFDSVITGFQVAISKYLSSGVNNTFGTGGFETFFLFFNFSFFLKVFTIRNPRTAGIKNRTYFSFLNWIQISDSVFRRQTLFSVL